MEKAKSNLRVIFFLSNFTKCFGPCSACSVFHEVHRVKTRIPSNFLPTPQRDISLESNQLPVNGELGQKSFTWIGQPTYRVSRDDTNRCDSIVIDRPAVSYTYVAGGRLLISHPVYL